MAKSVSIRIHGDNILECETALKLVSASLSGTFSLVSGPAYAPVYELSSKEGENFTVQLLPGYGRWNFPFPEYIAALGGTLRESPDAVITKLERRGKGLFEIPLLALEFSGALPAGNNAWQRTGRALSLAYAKIPYLYFAELGGQELDSERKIKAARFPNPLVPFAYVVLGDNTGSMSLPIYVPSPSSSQEITRIFKDCFSTQESFEIVKGILHSKDTKTQQERIRQKVLKLLEVLSQRRKRDDVLKPKEWAELYSKKSGVEKAEWLVNKNMSWNKKTGIKTLTSSFRKLVETTKKNGAVAVGSKEIPFCLIPATKRALLSSKVKSIYKGKINDSFITWLKGDSHHLICVWVAGFKPRGDDSRPDRGLVPLARMIFGVENIDLLTIVYGPAKPEVWEGLKTDTHGLAATNGLWEAIVNLSDGVIVDSSTSKKLTNVGFLINKNGTKLKETVLPAASDQPSFGEQDIDSVLHLIFSTSSDKIYESMCNPPGGDWSGVNILETGKGVELRWTSLPRVSGAKSKRPDHLIQFLSEKTLISIESKDTSSKLEKEIGSRLNSYSKSLLAAKPIAVRKFGSNTWKQYKGGEIEKFEFISGGAFRYENESDLKETLVRAQVNIVLGIEFLPKNKDVVIHVLTNGDGKRAAKMIENLVSNLKGLISIQMH